METSASREIIYSAVRGDTAGAFEYVPAYWLLSLGGQRTSTKNWFNEAETVEWIDTDLPVWVRLHPSFQGYPQI